MFICVSVAGLRRRQANRLDFRFNPKFHQDDPGIIYHLNKQQNKSPRLEVALNIFCDQREFSDVLSSN